MTENAKQQYNEEERAKEIIKAWETVPLSELEWACKYFDGAILLLINRMENGGQSAKGEKG